MSLFSRLNFCNISLKNIFIFLSLAGFSANSLAGGQCVAPDITDGSVPSDLIGERIEVDFSTNSPFHSPDGSIFSLTDFGIENDVFVQDGVSLGTTLGIEYKLNSDNVFTGTPTDAN